MFEIKNITMIYDMEKTERNLTKTHNILHENKEKKK